MTNPARGMANRIDRLESELAEARADLRLARDAQERAFLEGWEQAEFEFFEMKKRHAEDMTTNEWKSFVKGRFQDWLRDEKRRAKFTAIEPHGESEMNEEVPPIETQDVQPESPESFEDRKKQFHENFAGVLYDTYCAEVGGVAFNGDPLPTWSVFRADPQKLKQSEAWVKVAETAGTYVFQHRY